MKPNSVYSRTISSEEAREEYILVLKHKLSFFPSLGKPFELDGGNEKRTARVESYACQCQGPSLPHEHYFISWRGLKRGDKIMIRRDESKEKSYQLRVQHS